MTRFLIGSMTTSASSPNAPSLSEPDYPVQVAKLTPFSRFTGLNGRGHDEVPVALSTVQIGRYVATQQRAGKRYPLVLMVEPTLACKLACIGCGKIREHESNRARLTVEECIDAGVQAPRRQEARSARISLGRVD